MTTAQIDDIAVERLMARRAPKPKPVAMPMQLPKPWHLVLAEVLYRFVLTVSLRSVVYWLIRKPLSWLIEHGYYLAVTVASGKVGPGEFAERQRICSECSRQRRVGRHAYCAACGCPRTIWARLEYKNHKRGHNCPLGSHVGSRTALSRRAIQGVTHGN